MMSYAYFLNTGLLTSADNFWLKFKDTLILLSYVNLTFLSLVSLLTLSFILTSLPNLIYQVVNLSFLSLIAIALWITTLGNSLVLMAYILAFVGAVIMLFLAVIMMLPSSVIIRQPQRNFIVFLPAVVLTQLVAVFSPAYESVANLFIFMWAAEAAVLLSAVCVVCFKFQKIIKPQHSSVWRPVFRYFVKNSQYMVFEHGFTLNDLPMHVVIIYHDELYFSENVHYKIRRARYSQYLLHQHTFKAKPEPLYVWWLYFEAVRMALHAKRASYYALYPIFLKLKRVASPDESPLALLRHVEPRSFQTLIKFFNLKARDANYIYADNERYEAVRAIHSPLRWLRSRALSLVIRTADSMLVRFFYLVRDYNRWKASDRRFDDNHWQASWSPLREVLVQLTLSLWVFATALNIGVLSHGNAEHLRWITAAINTKNEGILGIKHTLYETDPLLVIVSVLVLLVALIGASVLSKKSN